MTVRKIKAGRIPTIESGEYVGELGTIFYSEDTGELRLSDGVTAGGIPVIANVAANLQNQIDSLRQSIDANTLSNLTQIVSTVQNIDLAALANVSALSSNVSALNANAVSQQGQINNLVSNVSVLTTNASSQQGQINSLSANANIIYNGNSRVSVNTVNGNVVVTANAGTARTWSFGTNGNLILPAGGTIVNSNGVSVLGGTFDRITSGNYSLVVQPQGHITVPTSQYATAQIFSQSGVDLYVGTLDSSNYWQFKPGAVLQLPKNSQITESISNIITAGNIVSTVTSVDIKPAGASSADQFLRIYPTVGEGNHVHVSTGDLQYEFLLLGDDQHYVQINSQEVSIGTNGGDYGGGIQGNVWRFNDTGQFQLASSPDGFVSFLQNTINGTLLWVNAKEYTFGRDGNLKLPVNGGIVDSNGISVLGGVGGGAANTGNITFNDITIQGVGNEYGGGGIYLSPDAGLTANLMYFRVRGGDNPTHLHFDVGDNTVYDQYFGDDGKYLKLEAGYQGNVLISTNGYGNWKFDIDGNLILPQTAMDVSPAPVSWPGITFSDGTFQKTAWPSWGNLQIEDNNNQLSFGPGESFSFLTMRNDGTETRLANDSGNVRISAMSQYIGTAYYWNFVSDGNLTLPQTVMNASPAPISWPGVTFSDGTFQNTAFPGGTGDGDLLTTYLTAEAGWEDARATDSPGQAVLRPWANLPSYSAWPAIGAFWAAQTAGSVPAGQGTAISQSYYTQLRTAANVGSAAYSSFVNSKSGNVRITANTKSWTFGHDGRLSVQGNIIASNLAVSKRITVGSSNAQIVENGSGIQMIAGSNGTVRLSSNNDNVWWIFDTTGELRLPLVNLSGRNGGHLIALGNVNINANNQYWTFNSSGGLVYPNGSTQTTAYTGNAGTIDVTNTNGLSNTYYPTFVEFRTTGQYVRADVDFTYRTDTNTLTVPKLAGTLNGNVDQANGYINFTGSPAPGTSGITFADATTQTTAWTRSAAQVQSNPPGSPVTGQFYYDTDDGRTYIYTGSAWVDSNPAGGGAGAGTTYEAFTTIANATGVVTHDATTSRLFYHTTPAGNFTANVTNLGLTTGQATSVTLVITQGATARSVTALQISGAAQTILWQGSATAPTGNASRTDVVTFSIMCTAANTFVTMGILTSFGGA